MLKKILLSLNSKLVKRLLPHSYLSNYKTPQSPEVITYHQKFQHDLGLEKIFSFNKYHLKVLHQNELPFYTDKVRDSKPTDTYDSEGIPLFSFKDGKKYYHPVLMIEDAVSYFLNKYVKNNDSAFLKRAEIIADKLIEEAETFNDAIYFPYKFSFSPHKSEYLKLQAPWYSGMAQGEALMLFARLFELTENKKYLEAAEKTFNSFKNLKYNNTPWTVFTDAHENYWIEEYPSPVTPLFTLNGKIYAIFGLYDYYRVTKSEEVYKILCAAITTIEKNIELFRVPNECSYYSLKPMRQLPFYHMIHVQQLDYLFKITGEQFFKDMAVMFRKDFWDETKFAQI